MDAINVFWQFLFILSNALLAGVIAWQVFLFNRTQKIKEEFMEFKLEIANHYAKKKDIDSAINKLDEKMDKLLAEFHNRTSHR